MEPEALNLVDCAKTLREVRVLIIAEGKKTQELSHFMKWTCLLGLAT